MPHFLKRSTAIALDVGAIEGIDRDERDLGVSLFIDLPADVGDLRGRVRIQNMGEIIDVTGG